MSALLEKTMLTQVDDDLANRAQAIYDEELKHLLEPAQTGKFVAIEPDGGKYFVGETGTAALLEARRAMPDSRFYLARIGYEAADTLHGYGNRDR